MAAPAEARVAAPTRPPPVVALGPAALGLALVVAAVSAAIGLHVFASFGVVPAGELLTVGLAGGIVAATRARVWSLELGLLVQTAAATATVGATLGLVLPLGAATAAGLSAGAAVLLSGAALVGAVALGCQVWLFDSALLPAAAAWPAARLVATEARGRAVGLGRALGLLTGLVGGHWASGLYVPPLVGAFGLAFLGNGFGLSLLAIGLVVRPSLGYILGADPDSQLVPHGLMVGAALAALAQVSLTLLGQLLRPSLWSPAGRTPRELGRALLGRLRSIAIGAGPAGHHLLLGAALSLAGYLVVDVVSFSAAGRQTSQGALPAAIGLAVVSALLALGAQLFGGLAGARVGWVPTLGIGLAILALADHLGLGPLSALLVIGLTFVPAPLAAELGTQLKIGAALGRPGLRSQQVLAGLVGLMVALTVVNATYEGYFQLGLIPPAATVLAALVQPGGAPLERLAGWALVGFLAQWLGGAGRQAGLLLATGLLVDSPASGWALLVGLAVRAVVGVVTRGRIELSLAIFGIGCIAGETLRLLLAAG